MSAPWIVVTGLDGSGKSHLVERLADAMTAKPFRLPYHDFVRSCLEISGDGSQFGDVHTDRMLFALDARLTNYRIRAWREAGQSLVSQRGWSDNFVFGAVQGFPYERTEALLRPSELERPTAYIHMIADPAAAFERIEADPDRDKYETAEFLHPQHRETVRLFREILAGHPALAGFRDIPATLIDSTGKTADDVYEEARLFLSFALPALGIGS